MLFGTLGGGLAAYDGQSFRVYTIEDGLPSNDILGLQQQPDGTMRVLTGKGVGRFVGDRCVESTTAIGGQPIGPVYDMATDAAGTTWLATLRRGVLSLEVRVVADDPDKRRTPNILSQNPVRTRLLKQVEQVAETDTRVLVLGETGVGKGLLAQTLHKMSLRREQAFIPVNCGGLPAGLVESDPWWAYDYDDIDIVESEKSFSDVSVSHIAVDRSGTLWATLKFWNPSEWTWPRPLSFNGTQWTSYQFDAWMIFPDSQGRVWMNCIYGLCVKDGSTWKRYDAVRIGDYSRWSIYSPPTEDAAGRLWIVDAYYFGMLEGTTWTGFPWEEFRVFRTPVVDSRGDLWIPSWDGLYRWHQSDLPTAIESSSMSTEPRSFQLEQNYPNPFNHATHIGFTLQQPAAVSLQVFNTHGQLVTTLVEGIRPAGTYQTVWDGRDAQGQAVSSGAYIVRLDAGGQQATRKMILIQ